ncbi:AtpZ/AtpI family protein [Fundidesulfovibrio agrisoli]|uniref:AtpZ/AtpI family protein n=1 Tax=Fundidesulfovibrio agrisoli TaxID=2922717 RepID=UPI001FAE32DD|nr:AtpZ/AtpI family protein [Fundidesulfovibrio agrisoli]
MILKKRDKSTWDGIEKAAMMGTNFVAHTVVGLVIGYYFDKWLNTAPWGLIVWLLLGIVAGFRDMYLQAMKITRSQSLDGPQAGQNAAPADAAKPGVNPEEKPGGKKDA